mmetsp:Transcript_3307/g.4807  ORF Transcript_3307/g.4807 Transcript_3307/m.4807 type:complete len:85 (-) Transcript_3307:171-425(-)
MILEDPECKALMDQHMKIKQRALAAMQSGDQRALVHAQKEFIELHKNPKFVQMMMPQMTKATRTVTAVVLWPQNIYSLQPKLFG